MNGSIAVLAGRRLTVVCVAVSLCIASFPARSQSFLQDFYNQAGGGQLNVTQAGVYQSAGLNTATGGGFVFKAPRRDFNPFFITPPSMRAGCGGIDIFLGAFGIPSRAEFVAFLRNIGQNLPGLAFQLALQSLAPDLEKQVADFRRMITDYTKDFTNSCQAAATLLEKTGAKEWIETQGLRARNWLRSAGVASDQSEADRMTRDNGEAVINNAQTVIDSGGIVQEAPELNLTWAMLSGGNWFSATPVELRQLMMTIVGTTIYRRVGAGADATLQADARFDKMNLALIERMVGELDSPTLAGQVRYLVCDDTTRCLNPSEQDYPDSSLANVVYTAARNYQTAIRTRNAALIDQTQMHMLASATTIPFIRIINAVSYNRYQGWGDDVLRVYSEAVAYELTMRFVETLAEDVAKASSAKQGTALASKIREHAKDLEERLKAIRDEASKRSQVIQERMVRAGAMITMVDHIERSVRGNLTSDLAANLRFASR